MEAEALDEYIEKNGSDVSVKFWKDNSQLSYNTDSPIPGQEVVYNHTVDTDENIALNNLIIKSAMAKAHSEAEIAKSNAEEERIKKQIIDTMMYNEGEIYYQKYHYVMDGKTKRKLKRMIEKKYNEGKYDYLKTTSNLNMP